MEARIFWRLTARQDRLDRVNATCRNGALRRYCTGVEGECDPERA